QMTTITSIIQKTRTWRKFSLYQRYLLLKALILLPLIHLSLNTLGFKRTYSILNIGNGEWRMAKSAVLGFPQVEQLSKTEDAKSAEVRREDSKKYSFLR
ncbi:MAG: hypothetical protein AAFY76_15705, partial [Cyanobacteria bacterium J06649_11]